MLNAQEILEKKFEKSAFGYRGDEVDEYLQELAAAFDKLQNEKLQMERKLEVLAEKIEEYRADEDSMRAAILDARKLGSSIVKDAQKQADTIVADANTQSAKVIDSIQMRAEREKMNLSHLQKEVATFKNQLLALYKNHLELISSLPENVKQEDAVSEEQEKRAPAEEMPTAQYEEPEDPPVLAVESAEPAQGVSASAEVVEEEPVAETERESRFGPLRFGAGYDLKRDR
ncbi:MAG: DivIVA domain-containing protein [Oscillospiraceae bacterium]|nr:DivIVA domain-containing protein [Oscillospiraceae bacterium]